MKTDRMQEISLHQFFASLHAQFQPVLRIGYTPIRAAILQREFKTIDRDCAMLLQQILVTFSRNPA